MQTNSSRYHWWLDLGFLTLLVGVFQFWLLGDRPLFVPDEGRYAEIAREMAATGDFITPYLNGVKYFEKPALFYWLGAIAIKIGGPTVWAVRSVNAIIAIFGCLLTYSMTRLLFDRITGLVAALILATSTLYFVMSHTVSLDLPVSVFMSATLLFFLLATQEHYQAYKRRLLWASSIFAAFAVLTKGLIGIVLPGIIVFCWIAICGKWRLLKQIHLTECILIFLAVSLPWHILVGYYNPEFFYFYIIEQHILRYTNPEIGHYQPAWFFIPVFLAAFFPWVAFLPQSLAQIFKAKNTKQWNNLVFLGLWAVIIFAFFSFSKSKLIPYILPVIPPLAILCALMLKTTDFHRTRTNQLSYAALVFASLLIAYVFHGFSQTTVLANNELAQHYLDQAALVLILSCSASFVFKIIKPRWALITLIAGSMAFLLNFLAAAPALDTRSVKGMSEHLKPLLKPDSEVITYNQYYQDLPFYLEKRVTILNWKNELTYGMKHQDTSDWMIGDAEFLNKWNSERTVYVILDRSEIKQFLDKKINKKPHMIYQTVNNVLITNHLGNNPT